MPHPNKQFKDLPGYTGKADGKDSIAGWSLEHILGQVTETISVNDTESTTISQQMYTAYQNYYGVRNIPVRPSRV